MSIPDNTQTQAFRVIKAEKIGLGTKVGAADIETQSGFVFHSALLHDRAGKNWIQFRSREWTGQDGKTHYVPVVGFRDEEAKERFQSAAIPLMLTAIAEASK